MALLTYPYIEPNLDWTHTAPYVDIGVFTSDDPNFQPPGHSIMVHEAWDKIDLPLSVDWSRIVAVMIDEPYYDDNDSNPACSPDGARNLTNLSKLDDLRDIAEEIHDRAPQARVWLNFHWREVEWMRDPMCPAVLNDAAFDVVSLDKYQVYFSDIEDDYEWFIEEWPEQQLALIPGTFYEEVGDAILAPTILAQYFDYANAMNQQCAMGLGRMGGTGSYDGCRVWVVAGYSSVPYLTNPYYDGELWGMLRQNDPFAASILSVWNSAFSKVRRSGMRTVSESATRALSDAELLLLLGN